MTTTTTSRQWRGYSLFHWILMVAALVFGALWFMSVIISTISIPDWVAPTGFLCLVVACWVP